jgi:hypothetical protein
MQQRWEYNNVVGVLQLLGRDFARVISALCDDVMVLISIACRAEPLGQLI